MGLKVDGWMNGGREGEEEVFKRSTLLSAFVDLSLGVRP